MQECLFISRLIPKNDVKLISRNWTNSFVNRDQYRMILALSLNKYPTTKTTKVIILTVNNKEDDSNNIIINNKNNLNNNNN